MNTYIEQETNYNFETFFMTPKKALYDSDQETNDDTSSSSSSTLKKLSLKENLSFGMHQEIDVKPKHKVFDTMEEKQQFIADYKKKWKTELCKNFMLQGVCRYGNSCSFAHGYHELQTKNNCNSSFKTKPCKKYFLSGYCPYGYRCQYLHQDIKESPQYYNFLRNSFKAKQISIDFTLPNFYQNLLEYLVDSQELIQNNERLPIFQNFQNLNTNANVQ